MSDNLKRKSPEDPKKININQQWELNYWSAKFNVSEVRLITAVKKVGVMVVNVERELKK